MRSHGAAAASVAVVGCGVNGAETARMLVAHGQAPFVWDVDRSDASWSRSASAPAWPIRSSTRSSCDAVITVTPGQSVLFPAGSLQDGQHVSLMGADGPGKAEVAVEELGARTCSATTGSRRATAES